MSSFGTARQDLADGRYWKARDRLTGSLVQAPANQELLELLGETYFLMGDHPEAGRYWLLTERSGDDVNEAIAAFEELHRRGGARGKLLAMKVRAPIDAFPPLVQERLSQLAAAAKADQDFTWEPKPRAEEPLGENSFGENVFVFFLFAGTIGIWLIGVLAIAFALIHFI